MRSEVKSVKEMKALRNLPGDARGEAPLAQSTPWCKGAVENPCLLQAGQKGRARVIHKPRREVPEMPTMARKTSETTAGVFERHVGNEERG